MHIRKSILFFILCIPAILSYSQIAEELITESTEPVFEEINEGPIDDIIPKRMITERMVLEYPEIREADIFWEKRIWRVLDIREKLNKPFNYPQAPFFNILTNGVSQGDLTVYSDEKFEKPLFEEDLNQILFRVDTVPILNPDTYEEELTIVKNEIDYTIIKRYRIKEVWYFDEQASVLRVQILGIAPVQDVIDKSTGEFLGEEPMFWVYYPNARKFFSRHKVFIEGNDANPLSWDDYLVMRFFSSYIYKESNVDDFRLVDYPSLAGRDTYSGVQRLMESEKIKQEIFNFEHDLWSY